MIDRKQPLCYYSPWLLQQSTISYRGLVKWYDRSLQNSQRQFDSVIPCRNLSEVVLGGFILYNSHQIGDSASPNQLFIFQNKIIIPLDIYIRHSHYTQCIKIKENNCKKCQKFNCTKAQNPSKKNLECYKLKKVSKNRSKNS